MTLHSLLRSKVHLHGVILEVCDLQKQGCVPRMQTNKSDYVYVLNKHTAFWFLFSSDLINNKKVPRIEIIRIISTINKSKTYIKELHFTIG